MKLSIPRDVIHRIPRIHPLSGDLGPSVDFARSRVSKFGSVDRLGSTSTAESSSSAAAQGAGVLALDLGAWRMGLVHGTGKCH